MALISRKDQRQLDRERKAIQRERRKRLEKAAPALLAACKLAEAYLQGDKSRTTFEESDLVGKLQSAIKEGEE